MVQHPIVMVAVLYKVSSEEETESLFFSFGLPFFIRSQHFHVGQGLFFPIEANHIFPFFVPKRFSLDQMRSWLLIFSFVYIPPYQAALLDLFENKYTFSQGSTPDFIGNLNFQNSSQNSFLWWTIFIMDAALHLKSCPFTHIALDVLKKDCFLTNWFKTCKDASAKN